MPCARRLADDLEQMRHLALGQRRRRLIHDQNIGFVGNRLGDLDHLPVGDAQIPHLAFRIEFDVQPLKQLCGHVVHLAVIDEAEAVLRFAPDPDILRHRHEWHQVELLMDHGDTILQRIERRFQADRQAFQMNLALIWNIYSSKDLHQRGFAGAVLAHQRMHSAALEPELHIVQRQNARKFLADVFDVQEIFRLRYGATGAHRCHGRGTDCHDHLLPERLSFQSYAKR